MKRGDIYDKLVDYIMEYITTTYIGDGNHFRYVCWVDDKCYNDIIKSIYKDIEVIWDATIRTIPALKESINDQIEGIRHIEATNGSLIGNRYNEGELKLTLLTEEFEPSKTINQPITSEEKTFKEDKCMICLDKEPNFLFCSCGHLCVCSECRKNLKNNKNMCVSCREISVNVRIIE